MGQKQEGNGMNRRPVLGSKTAEGLRSFKYSLLQCPKTTKIGSQKAGALKTGMFLHFLNIHSNAKYQKQRK